MPAAEITEGIDALAGAPIDIGDALAGMLEAPAEARTPAATEKPKISAAEATGLTAPRRVKLKTAASYFYDLSTSRRAIAQIEALPGDGESIHGIMGGDFHGFDLVVAIQELAAEPIGKLTLTTLGFNRHNVAKLCQMIDAGKVGSADILCSEYFSQSDASTFGFAERELTARGSRILACRNHSKIALFSAGARFFTLESSANLRSCNNLEQFALTQSRALHDFHAGWIGNLFTHAARSL